MTVTSAQARAKYGPPEAERGMILWDVPAELEIGAIPRRLYCNRDMVAPLQQAFRHLIDRNKVGELVTWDGCFNIRRKRGGLSASLHSWGLAVDVNAAYNRMGRKPTLSPEFVRCWTDAGFEWGGTWRIPDGMHFQLARLP